MSEKVRQPNMMQIIGFVPPIKDRPGYAGKVNIHPYNFDLKDAKRLQEWINRTVKFLEQKINPQDR